MFVRDEMETCIQPELASSVSKVVLISQDECIFQAHDGRRVIWQEKTRKEIRPKGPGASIMVSAFLCQCHGLLRLSKEQCSLYPEVESDSTVILYPGANKDGCFTNEHLAQQTKKMLKIFGILHPGCTALLAYDNSSNHHAMAADALVANRLNLKDGGKNVSQLINGWFNDSAGIVVEQTMVSASGKQKGIRSIMQEQGLFDPGMKLDDARKILESQPDFAQQKPLLNETVESLGRG